MKKSPLCLFLIIGLALCLPVLSFAGDGYQLFRLTTSGQILNQSGTVIHTDANIRFIHGARRTLYKVLKDGTLMATSTDRFGISPSWRTIGTRDPSITTRFHLSGGDNLLYSYPITAGSSFDGYYDAPLCKISGTSVQRWTGVSWVHVRTAIAIRGGYAMVSTGPTRWAAFSGTAVTGGIAGLDVDWLAHRGGWSSWDCVVHVQRIAASTWQIKRNGTVIDTFSPPWYIHRMATLGANALICWGIEDPEWSTADEWKQVWLYDGWSTGMELLYEGYVKDVQIAESDATAENMFVMVDDGVGTVLRISGFSRITRTLTKPAGQTVVQMTVSSITVPDE